MPREVHSMNDSYSRNISLAFASGSLGGLLQGLTSWFFGATGISAALGFMMTPQLTPMWLYTHVVWGGIWGFLFLLPIMKKSPPYTKGVVFSFAPALVKLLIVFPLKDNKGLLGLQLGYITPFLILFFNMVWGTAAATWLKFAEGRKSGELLATLGRNSR
jgi:hypothetical protein